MKDSLQKLSPIQKSLLILVTGVLMVVCGVGAFMLTLTFFMDLGMKRHNNYEYYGQTPAVALLYVAGALGFLAPGVVVWYLRNGKLPWQFSLRTLLIATTVVAVVLGVIVALSR